MKNLRGYKKQYFKLSIIAMYSTIKKLCNVETNNNLYHKKAYENKISSLDPPKTLEILLLLSY
ncbi:hypothetical protein [Arcobacter sp. CECT 8986]|uniref:hypothetical protein n=1 Tax=Arcobacter sp. CECT 8986 TaxID=2044507 RepID=UPI0013E952EF|nr:hypothetical protein [Arcobacter sp. CECT 8986]